MPRPREFDRDEVLDRALELFWTRGYEATSLQDLVNCTGLHRGSIYNAFGDKLTLFLAALDRYERLRVARIAERLRQPGSVREAVRQILEQVVRDSACPSRRGCFTTNTAVELAPHNPQVSAQIAAALGGVETAFCEALLRARESGEVQPRHEPAALARFLTSTLQGLRVMARTGATPAALQDVAEVALAALD